MSNGTEYGCLVRGGACLLTFTDGVNAVGMFVGVERMREMCADFAEALIKMERNYARTNPVQD